MTAPSKPPKNGVMPGMPTTVPTRTAIGCGKTGSGTARAAIARPDLDIVSDQDYLTEFRDGRSGFNETRDYFLEAFGRDLDTYDENTRTNRLNVNRTWTRYSLNGTLLWNDNVTNRRWEDTDDTLQQLPVIEFDSLTAGFWDRRLLGPGFRIYLFLPRGR